MSIKRILEKKKRVYINIVCCRLQLNSQNTSYIKQLKNFV